MREFFVRGYRRLSSVFSGIHWRPIGIALGVTLVLFLIHTTSVYAQTAAASQPETGFLGNSPTIGAFVTSAQTGLLNTVGQIIGIVLYALLYIIINIDILLTNLLISVAQYNGFVDAAPVKMGWPIIRDICNMFFIVIMLLIAFGTIIGSQEFHYKKYLGKLLFTAILINFSKTIVGLLIDVSQVVTLTFVAGFKEAAFGNFAKAFQLTEIMKINGGDVPGIWNIVAGLIFGLILLTVASTTLLIMLIYFIARIVGLWMVLILSPMMFLVDALPGPLKDALKNVAGEVKGKMTAWLTGGPIVAFFLWLSLAVVQSGGTDPQKGPFGDVFPGAGAAGELGSVTGFITQVANFSNLGNFIVAIAFMLMGVETAVKVSGQAASGLGKLASWVNKDGGLLYRAGIRPTAAFAGRTVAGGVKAGARFADTRLGISRSVAGELSNLSGRAARAGQSARAGGSRIGGIGYGLVSSALQAGSGAVGSISKGRMASFGKDMDDKMKDKSAADKVRILMAMDSRTFDPEQKALLAERQHELLSNPAGKKAYTGYLKDHVYSGMPEEQRDAHANMAYLQQLQQNRTDAKQYAKDYKMEKLEEAIKEEDKKNPNRNANYREMFEAIHGMEDPKAEMKAAGYATGAAYAAFAKAEGWTEADGSYKAGIENDARFKAYHDQKNESGKYMRAHYQNFTATDGQARMAALQGAMAPGAGQAQINAANAQNYNLNVTEGKDMGQLQYNPVTRTTAPVQMAPLAGAAGGSSYFFTTPMADIIGESRAVTNAQDLTRYISDPVERGAIITALGGAAAADAAAPRFSRPLTQDEGRVIAASTAVIAGNGPAVGNAAQQGQFRQLQQLGITGSQIGMYSETGEVPPARQAQVDAAIGSAVDNAFDDLDTGSAGDEKLAAAAFLSNIESGVVRAERDVSGMYLEALATNVSTPTPVGSKNNSGLDKLMRVVENANDDQVKKFTQTLREIDSIASRGLKKDPTLLPPAPGARTPIENNAIRIIGLINSKPKLRALVRGSKKK